MTAESNTAPCCLIVDDEPNLSDLVRMYLEKTESYDVRVENISAQAVSAARALADASGGGEVHALANLGA